jgi:hypothetical protein
MAIEIEPGSELDRAADAFFKAARAYREAMKSRAPTELGGVVFVRRGHESVVYSQSERYTQQIAAMSFDRHKDEIVFSEAPEEE